MKARLNREENKTSKGTVRCRLFQTNRAVFSVASNPPGLEATSCDTESVTGNEDVTKRRQKPHSLSFLEITTEMF